jgi:hypothetical protein
MSGVCKVLGQLTLAAEIVGRKVIRRLVREVIDEPSMAQRAVGHICDAEFLGRVDQTVRLMQRLEGRVLCLHSIDLRNYIYTLV